MRKERSQMHIWRTCIVWIAKLSIYTALSSLFGCPAWKHLHLSPLYDVLDHTNYIFSESLSSSDDNDQDEDMQKDKDTQTQTNTNTECFQDPMYAIFLKSRGFKDIWIWHLLPNFPPKNFHYKFSTKSFFLPKFFHLSTHILNIWVSHSLLGLVFHLAPLFSFV